MFRVIPYKTGAELGSILNTDLNILNIVSVQADFVLVKDRVLVNASREIVEVTKMEPDGSIEKQTRVDGATVITKIPAPKKEPLGRT